MTRKDIDAIFSKAKKTTTIQAISKKERPPASNKVPNGPMRSSIQGLKQASTARIVKSSRKSGSSADPFGLTPNQSSASLDFTEEGWKVYTPEELNIGKGGDTPDCPFDCNCCF